jgi:integrase/recombinase XerD
LSSIQERPPQVSDFNASSIGKFLEYERQEGRQRSTLLRRRASLRRFAKYLYDQKLIDSDPTREQELPESKSKRRGWRGRKPKILSDKEVEIIFQLMHKANTPRACRDLAILSVLLETGISISTLVAVDVSDFNLQNMRLQVWPDGFNSPYWLFIPQSGKLIPEYLRAGRPNLTDYHIEKALFVSQMGGRMSRQTIWQALQNWGNLANLKQKLSPRLVRYTSAARMLSKGMTINEIQLRLGHRNQFSTRAFLRRMDAAVSK